MCEGLPPFAAKFLNFTIGQLQIEIIRRDPKILRLPLVYISILLHALASIVCALGKNFAEFILLLGLIAVNFKQFPNLK